MKITTALTTIHRLLLLVVFLQQDGNPLVKAESLPSPSPSEEIEA